MVEKNECSERIANEHELVVVVAKKVSRKVKQWLTAPRVFHLDRETTESSWNQRKLAVEHADWLGFDREGTERSSSLSCFSQNLIFRMKLLANVGKLDNRK